jgi:hypothetical protein
VDLAGFEPATSSVRLRRAPAAPQAPDKTLYWVVEIVLERIRGVKKCPPLYGPSSSLDGDLDSNQTPSKPKNPMGSLNSMGAIRCFLLHIRREQLSTIALWIIRHPAKNTNPFKRTRGIKSVHEPGNHILSDWQHNTNRNKFLQHCS